MQALSQFRMVDTARPESTEEPKLFGNIFICETLVSLTPPSPRSPFIWYGNFQKINFRLEESKMSISPCFATKTDSPRGHPIPPKTNQIAAQFSSLEYKVHCPLPPFTSRFGCRTCGSWNDNDAANPHEFACDDEASTAAAWAVLGLERLDPTVLNGNGDTFDGNSERLSWCCWRILRKWPCNCGWGGWPPNWLCRCWLKFEGW